MKTLILSSFVLASLAVANPKVAAGEKAIGRWLKLVDGGKYEQSWKEAASFFKSQVKSDQWNKALKAARGPLGKVLSRKKILGNFHKELPGAPKGDYVVVQNKTTFAKKKVKTETITAVLDKDKKWRVGGYYIK